MAITPADWTEHQEHVFAHVFKCMVDHQELFVSRAAKPVPADDWQITAFNAATFAAYVAGGQTMVVVDEDRGETVMSPRLCH